MAYADLKLPSRAIAEKISRSKTVVRNVLKDQAAYETAEGLAGH